MLDVTLIRLDDGGVWWSDAMDGQGRFGYRMAIAARLQTEAGSLAAVAAHLESKSDATDRARQTARLLEAVDRFAGDLPVVIGGDFNTNALPEQCRDPLGFEPLFNVLAEHGYDWERANDFALTQRTRPDGTPTRPLRASTGCSPEISARAIHGPSLQLTKPMQPFPITSWSSRIYRRETGPDRSGKEG
ncbi:hypothetical protein HED49_20585 [Ochrobactrum daejeonense]|nr:hypothetical protein [Brucella daejeonensis]